MLMELTRECPCCNGQGRVPLNKVYQDTLDTMGTEWVTAREVADRTRVQISTMSMRLLRLREMGLIEQERIKQTSGGYEYAYRVLREVNHE